MVPFAGIPSASLMFYKYVEFSLNALCTRTYSLLAKTVRVRTSRVCQFPGQDFCSFCSTIELSVSPSKMAKKAIELPQLQPRAHNHEQT